MEDGSVMTTFEFREEHQSFPQRVHGGIIATMLDEIDPHEEMCYLIEDDVKEINFE